MPNTASSGIIFPPEEIDCNKVKDTINKVRLKRKKDKLEKAQKEKSPINMSQAKSKIKKTTKKINSDEDKNEISKIVDQLNKSIQTYHSNFKDNVKELENFQTLFRTLKEYKENFETTLSKDIQTFFDNGLSSAQQSYVIAGKGPLGVQKTVECLYDENKLINLLNTDNFKNVTVKQSMLKIAQGFRNSWAKETMPEIKKLKKWNNTAQKLANQINSTKS